MLFTGKLKFLQDLQKVLLSPDTDSEFCQTSEMDYFAKIAP